MRFVKIFCTLLLIAVSSFASSPLIAESLQGQTFSFELGNDHHGDPVQLSALQGKVVLISFWTSWCPQCRKELPKLAAIQQKAGHFGIQVVAINVKEDRKIFRDAVRQFRDSGMLMIHDRNGRLADEVGVDAYPRLLVVGKDGLIEGDYRGYSQETFERLLTQLIQLLEPASAEAKAE